MNVGELIDILQTHSRDKKVCIVNDTVLDTPITKLGDHEFTLWEVEHAYPLPAEYINTHGDPEEGEVICLYG